ALRIGDLLVGNGFFTNLAQFAVDTVQGAADVARIDAGTGAPCAVGAVAGDAAVDVVGESLLVSDMRAEAAHQAELAEDEVGDLEGVVVLVAAWDRRVADGDIRLAAAGDSDCAAGRRCDRIDAVDVLRGGDVRRPVAE